MPGVQSIRVATWNLWWRHGGVDRRHPAIVETLRRVDADVVGFQEFATSEPDMRTWFGDELGYEVVTAPDGDEDRYGLTNAIASRHPITDTNWEYLDVGEMPPHRTVLRAAIAAPTGPLDVYCTHLSHGFDQSGLRRRQLAQIARLVERERGDPKLGLPPLLLGDLNAVPDSDEIRAATGLAEPPVAGLVFTDCWAQTGDGEGVTYSSENVHVNDSAWPDRRLDYVMVAWPRARPAGNPVDAFVFGDEPIDGVTASDHFGVAVDVRLPDEPDSATATLPR